jgi:hypothetical protein
MLDQITKNPGLALDALELPRTISDAKRLRAAGQGLKFGIFECRTNPPA